MLRYIKLAAMSYSMSNACKISIAWSLIEKKGFPLHSDRSNTFFIYFSKTKAQMD